MASKSVHQPFIPEAITHFGIDCDPYGIMVSQTSGEIATVYADESSCTYNKIENILTTQKTTPNLSSYKKAFIMPGCPVSIDRSKAALKEHNIILTNDYEQADVYIYHDRINKDFHHSENIQTSCMLFTLMNYKACDEGCSTIENYCNDSSNMRSGETARVIWDTKVSENINTYNVEDLEFPYDVWIMTGMAVNLAYNIEIGIADVINIEEILMQSANKIIINEQLIEDLRSQCNSYNDDDNSIAAKILPTIDFNKELHLMWKLSQEIAGDLYRVNNEKDVKYWIENSKIEDFYHKSAEDMILWLKNHGKLDRKSFKYLEPICRKEICIDNRELYTFKVEVKPEYKEYLKKEKLC
mgnify:CR=1 FL=1